MAQASLPPFPARFAAASARQYIFDITRRWMDPNGNGDASDGVDGWRLDVPEEIGEPGFWEEFRRRVLAVNPEADLVGEIWTPARNWLIDRWGSNVPEHRHSLMPSP